MDMPTRSVPGVTCPWRVLAIELGHEDLDDHDQLSRQGDGGAGAHAGVTRV